MARDATSPMLDDDVIVVVVEWSVTSPSSMSVTQPELAALRSPDGILGRSEEEDLVEDLEEEELPENELDLLERSSLEARLVRLSLELLFGCFLLKSIALGLEEEQEEEVPLLVGMEFVSLELLGDLASRGLPFVKASSAHS